MSKGRQIALRGTIWLYEYNIRCWFWAKLNVIYVELTQVHSRKTVFVELSIQLVSNGLITFQWWMDQCIAEITSNLIP